jgi:hypothetical protein
MKNITYLLLLSLLAHACVDDTGNYEYVNAGTLTPAGVSGIESSYTMYMMDTLRVTPTLLPVDETVVNEEDYDYLWYIYSNTMPFDTIGREKNLDYLVTLVPALDYRIAFQITNRRTGVFEYYHTTLRVTTPFAEGWYITKDINQVTDIDMVRPDGAIARDILKGVNGEGVPGEGIIWADARHITVIVPLGDGRDTIYTDHNCFYVMTNSTVQLYNIDNMMLLNKIDNLFMKVPDNLALQELNCSTDAKVIVNDNLAYPLDTHTKNIGKWGIVAPGARIDGKNMCRSFMCGHLVFDIDTRSFKQLNAFKGVYVAINNMSMSGAPACNNMDSDMIFMQEKEELMQGGVAIMQDRSTGTRYGLTIGGIMSGLPGLWENPLSTMIYNPIATHVAIPEGSKVLDAVHYGVHRNMNVLYFSKGDNEVWYYDLTSPREARVATFPAGESVTFVNTCARYVGAASYYYLTVLTHEAGTWKLYVYDFQPSSPLLVAEPVAVYSGEGYPRHVHYRSLTSVASF